VDNFQMADKARSICSRPESTMVVGWIPNFNPDWSLSFSLWKAN